MQEEHTRKGDLAHVISLRDKIVLHKREPAFMRPRLQTSKRYIVFIFRNKCGPRSRFDVHPSPVVLSNVTGVYIFIYITFLFCFFLAFLSSTFRLARVVFPWNLTRAFAEIPHASLLDSCGMNLEFANTYGARK